MSLSTLISHSMLSGVRSVSSIHIRHIRRPTTTTFLTMAPTICDEEWAEARAEGSAWGDDKRYDRTSEHGGIYADAVADSGNIAAPAAA